MKTLKKQSIDTSGKVATEYLRVKNEDVGVKLKDDFKLCPKVEWKKKVKGYEPGQKDDVKAQEDVTEGLPKKHYQKRSKS